MAHNKKILNKSRFSDDTQGSKKQLTADQFPTTAEALITMDGFGKFDATMMAKPIFFIPKDPNNMGSRMENECYSNFDEYADEEITQMMMVRSAGWPDAIKSLTHMATNNPMDNNVYNCIRRTTANTIEAVTEARLNYFINNALNILITEILTILNDNKVISDIIENRKDIAPSIGDGIINGLYDITKNLNIYKNEYGTKFGPIISDPVILHLIMQCKKDSNHNNEAVDNILAQVFASADITAMNLTAFASNHVYNVLYRNLSIFVGPDFLQELASDLTPAFIGFRNTIHTAYNELYAEIAGCDHNIDPKNPLLTKYWDDEYDD